MLLHSRIGPTQIDGLIIRPSRLNLCIFLIVGLGSEEPSPLKKVSLRRGLV